MSAAVATRHQRVLAAIDCSAVRVEQLLRYTKQFRNLRYGQPVEHLASLSGTVNDEAALAQASQMAGHVGLRSADDLDQVSHAALAVEQLAQDRDSGWLSEPAKHPGGQFRRGRRCSRHADQGTAASSGFRPDHVR